MPSAGSWQWAGNVSYGSDSFSIPECQHPFLKQEHCVIHLRSLRSVCEQHWKPLYHGGVRVPLEQDLVPIAVGPVQGIRCHHCDYESLQLRSSIAFKIMTMTNMIRRQHATIFLSHQRKPAWSTHHPLLQSRHLRSDISIKYFFLKLLSQKTLSVLNRLSSVRGPPLASSFLREGFVTSRGRFLWLGPFQKEVGGIWKHW